MGFFLLTQHMLTVTHSFKKSFFIKQTILNYIYNFSQNPSNTFYKFQGSIQNKYYCPLWEKKNKKKTSKQT